MMTRLHSVLLSAFSHVVVLRANLRSVFTILLHHVIVTMSMVPTTFVTSVITAVTGAAVSPMSITTP